MRDELALEEIEFQHAKKDVHVEKKTEKTINVPEGIDELSNVPNILDVCN
jgi:hypothetical protein